MLLTKQQIAASRENVGKQPEVIHSKKRTHLDPKNTPQPIANTTLAPELGSFLISDKAGIPATQVTDRKRPVIHSKKQTHLGSKNTLQPTANKTLKQELGSFLIPDEIGPRTKQQIATKRANAKRRCRLAHRALFATESRGHFLELLRFLHKEYEPSTLAEHRLIATMAMARWRTRRLWLIRGAHLTVKQGYQASKSPGDESDLMLTRYLEDCSRLVERLCRMEATYRSQYNDAARSLLRHKANPPSATGIEY